MKFVATHIHRGDLILHAGLLRQVLGVSETDTPPHEGWLLFDLAPHDQLYVRKSDIVWVADRDCHLLNVL